jgi:hypothetical protein
LDHHTSVLPSLISRRPSSSSTAIVGGQSHSTLSRPKLRARGMTDGGTTKKAGFFSDERSPSKKLCQKSSTSTFSTAPTEHTSPRVVIRHTSLNRLIAPPCDPPAHSLPATPITVSHPTSSQIARTESSSPSCISFASSSSNDMLPALCYPLREKRYSERSVFSQDHNPDIPAKGESKAAPSSPRKLKKHLSQQSLSSKSNVQPPTLPTLPKLPPDKMMDKVFRKQKTPNHTRSPMPPIPGPVSPPSPVNSTTFPSLPDLSPKAASENLLGRRKVYSHSSTTTRPSTSHCPRTTTEDDSLSIYSLRSERSTHMKPWASPKAAPQSSLWDETGSLVTSSSARSTSEYTPQPILSAAEVAKLEASIESSPDISTRGRAFSLLSTSTTASDRENLDFTPVGLSPPPTAKPRSKPGSMRSLTARTPAFHSPSSSRAWGLPRSPSINGNPNNDSRSTIRFQPFSSGLPAELGTSLPPPPRSRHRAQLVSYPEPSNPARSFSSSALKSSRSKSSLEKNINRRSILKKPSFLEIDDDTDQDTDLFSGEATPDSFLDLAGEPCEDSNGYS